MSFENDIVCSYSLPQLFPLFFPVNYSRGLAYTVYFCSNQYLHKTSIIGVFVYWIRLR